MKAKIRSRVCPHCGISAKLSRGESFSFCHLNPRREKALDEWFSGSKRFRPRNKPYKIVALPLKPSPFVGKKRGS